MPFVLQRRGRNFSRNHVFLGLERSAGGGALIQEGRIFDSSEGIGLIFESKNALIDDGINNEKFLGVDYRV